MIVQGSHTETSQQNELIFNTPGQLDFYHAADRACRHGTYLAQQEFLGRLGDVQPFAAPGEAIHVLLPVPRVAMFDGHRFEKPVTVRQAPVVCGYVGGDFAIDQTGIHQ